MSASIKDIVEKTGYSPSTISRVLNNSELVNEQTSAIVLQAVEELGYRPSHSARALRLQRTSTLGVILPKLEGSFYTHLLAGIDEVASERNYYLMTTFSQSGRTEKDLLSIMLQEGRVDGLIFFNITIPDETILQAAEEDLALVMIGRPVPGASIATVTVDNIGGADLAMTHLLDHGYEAIAVITGGDDNYDSQQRLVGCCSAAERAGVPLRDELIWHGQFTEQSGYEATARWLDTKDGAPEAILALNDDMAVGTMNALRDRGIRVPNDVGVMGFDDTDAAKYTGLTTIRVPMHDMGRAAANVAILQVMGNKVQTSGPMETELVVRRTCGCVTAQAAQDKRDT